MKKILSLSCMALVAMMVMAQYPSRVYLCGPAGPGWATQQWPMFTDTTDQGAPSGVYEWVGDLNDGELKLLYGSGWEPGFAPLAADEPLVIGANSIFDRHDSDPDNKWAVTAGRYRMVLNLTDTTLTVEDGTGLDGKNGEGQVFFSDYLFLVGNGCGAGWSDANAIGAATTAYGVYTITTTLYGHTAGETHNEIKFLSAPNFGVMPQVGPMVDGEEIDGPGTYTAAAFTVGDYKWHNVSTETKVYIITVDLNAGTMVVADPTTPTGLDENVNMNVNKVMRNGQMIIIRDGVLYDVTGKKL